MLAYVTDALTRFRHDHPRKPQHQPYPRIEINYGAKYQYSEAANVSPTTIKADKKIVQEVKGDFLYYAWEFNPTMLTALEYITAQQAKPTEQKMKKVKQFLDYASTHPDAIIKYHASDMVLSGHSYASYLYETKARSRAGRNLFMSNNTELPINNGTVLNISKIIKAVMSSAAEAELGALFINCK